jgi:hydrogenase expression/formation protein HypC
MTPPECHDDVCITCSDQAVQVTITRLLADGMAVVQAADSEGTAHEETVHEETVSVALVDAHLGDTILVHAKEAIAVVST